MKKLAAHHQYEDGFVRLFISKRLLHGAVAALCGLFIPIFLYQIFDTDFRFVASFYLLLSVGYVLFMTLCAQIMNHIGFRMSLVIAAAADILILSIFFFLTKENVWYLIGPLFITMLIFRLFHWVPYHVDFTIFTRSQERGRDVSLTFATISFFGVIGPILSGYIIETSGFQTLFAITAGLLVITTISYLFVPETNEVFEWTHRETLKSFFSPKYRAVVTSSFALGLESVITVVIWPIFLYETLAGDIFDIGAVSTLVVGVTILIQLALGRYLDLGKNEKKLTLQVGSGLSALGWIFKMFVISAAQVFFVDLYHSVSRVFTKTPYTAMVYDFSADQGHYVDEVTVLREISVHLGRAIALFLVLGMIWYLPLSTAFVIAAIGVIALNMIYHRVHN